MTAELPESSVPTTALLYHFDDAVGVEWYRRMALIRGIEAKLSEVAVSGELPGPVHVSIGQEAVAVGVTGALGAGDWVASTHRGHGHFLALGGQPRLLVAEIFGRRTGVCGGKGGSMHVADFGRGMLGANGIVGAGIGLATGAALSCQQLGRGNVAVAFFGDGGANEGLFFEAMNLAAVWSLPLIFVCENNGWSEFTATHSLTAGSIETRAETFGLPHGRVDGNDVSAVAAVAGEAIERARRGEGASLIEAWTYRTHGHVEAEATFLPRSYREEAEIDEWRRRDPLGRLRDELARRDLSQQVATIDVAVEATVSEAFSFAAGSDYPDPDEALLNVFVEEGAA